MSFFIKGYKRKLHDPKSFVLSPSMMILKENYFR